MTSEGVSGAGTFLLNWKRSRGDVAVEGGSSCSADAAYFLHSCPQTLKPTSKREMNQTYAPPCLFYSQW